MDEYLIQGSTLTDIADAIREKTGDSALMTPAEMVEAIEEISGGSSPTYEWKKLAEYAVTEEVRDITISATPEMLAAKGLQFDCNLTLTSSDYIYFALNNPSTSNRSYTAQVSSFSGYSRVDPYVRRSDSATAYYLQLSNPGVGGYPATLYSLFTSMNIRTYTASKKFAIGSTVTVWGYVES